MIEFFNYKNKIHSPRYITEDDLLVYLPAIMTFMCINNEQKQLVNSYIDDGELSHPPNDLKKHPYAPQQLPAYIEWDFEGNLECVEYWIYGKNKRLDFDGNEQKSCNLLYLYMDNHKYIAYDANYVAEDEKIQINKMEHNHIEFVIDGNKYEIKTVIEGIIYFKNDKMENFTIRPSFKFTEKFGNVHYEMFYSVDDKLHHATKPACKKYDNNFILCQEQWCENGKLHMDNGPAIKNYKNGKLTTIMYFKDGTLHSKNGPVQLQIDNGLLQVVYSLCGKITPSLDSEEGDEGDAIEKMHNVMKSTLKITDASE